MTPTRLTKTATTVALTSLLALQPIPSFATCGGGGGGGMGGARAGGSSGPVETEAYRVPWQVVGPSEMLPGGALAVYWFPSSAAEAKSSTLLTSRTLAMLSSRCVALALVTPDNDAARRKFSIPEQGSGAVIVDGAAAELGRVMPDGKPISASPVEKLLDAELDKREDAAKGTIDQANEKIKQNDVDGATAMLNQVWAQHCLIPDVAKKAAKTLKKLGHPVEVGDASIWGGRSPDLSPATTAAIVKTMNAGLAAERSGDIEGARRLYTAATRIDPADATPVRFLGELLRHEIGDWDAARSAFNRVLEMPADAISRAVALHGLGKMTIHDGRYAEGLALFQRSLDAFPLPLTYRNLAVYWNSEKDHVKAHAYVEKALALDPDDDYNRIFAATYFVELGRPDEARAIAARYEAMLPASYNLAVIHAQLGEKDKALELLQRHFGVYEKFDAVRAKEMQEARDDIAFASLHRLPEFVTMTSLADRDIAAAPMPR
jgi:tetratricopeptide (TPR) repeat protein